MIIDVKLVHPLNAHCPIIAFSGLNSGSVIDVRFEQLLKSTPEHSFKLCLTVFRFVHPEKFIFMLFTLDGIVISVKAEQFRKSPNVVTLFGIVTAVSFGQLLIYNSVTFSGIVTAVSFSQFSIFKYVTFSGIVIDTKFLQLLISNFVTLDGIPSIFVKPEQPLKEFLIS